MPNDQEAQVADYQRLLDTVIYADSNRTDKVINQYHFRSNLRPAISLLAFGIEDPALQDRYFNDRWVWLEGQIMQWAFGLPRSTYDAAMKGGGIMRVVLWRDTPYIAVDRDRTAVELVPISSFLDFRDNRPPIVLSDAPPELHKQLLEIATSLR